MTLREELEMIRNEPIGDLSMDERSWGVEVYDKERICKKPLVSVVMITYNHEKYLARAIESVVTQRTDFDFELIIGEDRSSDRTWKICCEYQKRYPDRIRLVFSDENIGAAANVSRVSARVRGEFSAICEGDDYWCDIEKLQKQVAVMRENPSVGLCVCGARIYHEKTGEWRSWNEQKILNPGFIPGKRFFVTHLFGKSPYKAPVGDEVFLPTASVMLRRSIVNEVRRKFELLGWNLRLCDTPLWLAISSIADVYYLQDEVSVYYQYSGGAMGQGWVLVARDAIISRLYFGYEVLGLESSRLPSNFIQKQGLFLILQFSKKLSKKGLKEYFVRITEATRFGSLILSWRLFIPRLMMTYTQRGETALKIMFKVMAIYNRFHSCPRKILECYDNG